MRGAILRWLSRKWSREVNASLAQDYRATFETVYGQRVLDHWMDNVYCTVYEGTDVQQLWQHNARRAFVQEILENLDMAARPEKYQVKTDAGEVG